MTNDYGYPPVLDQECGNCRYARALKRLDDAISCRRHSPAVRVSLDDPTIWGTWPAVFPSYWCGEWAPEGKI